MSPSQNKTCLMSYELAEINAVGISGLSSVKKKVSNKIKSSQKNR